MPTSYQQITSNVIASAHTRNRSPKKRITHEARPQNAPSQQHAQTYTMLIDLHDRSECNTISPPGAQWIKPNDAARNNRAHGTATPRSEGQWRQQRQGPTRQHQEQNSTRSQQARNTDLRPHSTTDLKPAEDRRRDPSLLRIAPRNQNRNEIWGMQERRGFRQAHQPSGRSRARAIPLLPYPLLLGFGRGEENETSGPMRGAPPGFKRWGEGRVGGAGPGPGLRGAAGVHVRRVQERVGVRSSFEAPTCNRRFASSFPGKKVV